MAVAYYNNSRKREELSPAEKFLGRRTRIQLDLLKQEIPPEMDSGDNVYKFGVGQTVWARIFGGNQKWESGVVIENVGHKLHRIRFSDGREGMRHRDQLKRGMDPGRLRSDQRT
ncbi:uncharacterized protein LOC135930214 [Gordionus sp. m RMFG-2023]|uniref:uncharacterized protein LOC135930214 n=1 Tax=Gordionus sp. m RMFG-2023 TaxID=3053472 RepID=UPI0031FD28E1